MRTVSPRSVYDGVISRFGIDPLGQVPPDTSRNVVRNINTRVRTACRTFDWPQWMLTEERAFRSVWNDTRQFLRVGEGGKPDEFFFRGDNPATDANEGEGYYRVLAGATIDPPIGTSPTDTSYFEALTPVDSYIAYDQTCKRSIGMVLGVYARNPRLSPYGMAWPLEHRPSERGMDVFAPSGPTVFIWYQMPVPQFTMVPWVFGKIYAKGSLAFDPVTQEVFQALAQTSNIISDSTVWRRVPFPEEWANFVEAGVFSDCLMELDQGPMDAAYEQVKLAKATKAGEEAWEMLEDEMAALASQGLVHKYGYNQRSWRSGGVTLTQPWSAGTVSELTSVCEDELGWVYPAPGVTPQVAWIYGREIRGIYSPLPSLSGVKTVNLLPDSLIEIVIVPLNRTDKERQTYIVEAGAANTNDPGQVVPDDFNAVSNNKHWTRVSG